MIETVFDALQLYPMEFAFCFGFAAAILANKAI